MKRPLTRVVPIGVLALAILGCEDQQRSAPPSPGKREAKAQTGERPKPGDDAAEQRRAVAQIEKLGGRVMPDFKAPHLPIRVDFSDTQVTDAALTHLTTLPQLKRLFLSRTAVSDAGLEHIAGLTQLEALELSGTRVTGAGLAHLHGLAQLKQLYLTGTGVTDAGLKHLQHLPQLATLGLSDTQITDAGLEHLKAVPHLVQLYLHRAPVTSSGIDSLRRALPGLRIDR